MARHGWHDSPGPRLRGPGKGRRQSVVAGEQDEDRGAVRALRPVAAADAEARKITGHGGLASGADRVIGVAAAQGELYGDLLSRDLG